MLQSLLCDTVQLATGDSLLVLNSAWDPFVLQAAQQLGAHGEQGGKITLAEDNIASLQVALSALNSLFSEKRPHIQHVPFHEYTLHNPMATMDVAVMNLLYQPSNAWMLYGLEVADYALKPGGRLYVEGAKDRGILTIAKRMQKHFGNVETLEIKKGHRLVCSRRDDRGQPTNGGISRSGGLEMLIPSFAKGNLDEGTRLLLEALEVFLTDEALDIGCGAGFLGIHIARRASKGQVTMVDASGVEAEIQKLAQQLEFRVDTHTLEFSGLCRTCQAEQGPTPRKPDP